MPFEISVDLPSRRLGETPSTSTGTVWRGGARFGGFSGRHSLLYPKGACVSQPNTPGLWYQTLTDPYPQVSLLFFLSVGHTYMSAPCSRLVFTRQSTTVAQCRRLLKWELAGPTNINLILSQYSPSPENEYESSSDHWYQNPLAVSFGADPTGKTDSTKAFMAAMASLLNTTARSAVKMASGIFDMGGATLDLEGELWRRIRLPFGRL